mmetsp:Transcript_38444/g.63007  ORF Transcript_38444/g.63007 Transcript_38444/m.63007 type:complete len:297 (-) Transcript_38444:196-1086(-)
MVDAMRDIGHRRLQRVQRRVRLQQEIAGHTPHFEFAMHATPFLQRRVMRGDLSLGLNHFRADKLLKKLENRLQFALAAIHGKRAVAFIHAHRGIGADTDTRAQLLKRDAVDAQQFAHHFGARLIAVHCRVRLAFRLNPCGRKAAAMHAPLRVEVDKGKVVVRDHRIKVVVLKRVRRRDPIRLQLWMLPFALRVVTVSNALLHFGQVLLLQLLLRIGTMNAFEVARTHIGALLGDALVEDVELLMADHVADHHLSVLARQLMHDHVEVNPNVLCVVRVELDRLVDVGAEIGVEFHKE